MEKVSFFCLASGRPKAPRRLAAPQRSGAATEADAQRQYATLSNCCDALVEALDAAAAGGGLELPHDALHAFRTKLEEHLCYWRPPPRPSGTYSSSLSSPSSSSSLSLSS